MLKSNRSFFIAIAAILIAPHIWIEFAMAIGFIALLLAYYSYDDFDNEIKKPKKQQEHKPSPVIQNKDKIDFVNSDWKEID